MSPKTKPIVLGLRTLILALLACLAAGCKQNADNAPEALVPVQAAHPTIAPITEQITADAILAPVSVAALSPRISAPIRAEYVQRGAHVHRGQLLVTLEDRDLRASALDSQGAVTAAEAGYLAVTNATIPEELIRARLDADQLKTALEVAETTTAERRKLYAQGAISGRDVDLAKAAEAQARAAYETARDHAEAVAKTIRVTDRQTAEGLLSSAKGRLENAQAQVSFATLRSPIDGVVTERPLFPGETASAGSPVITVMDTSHLLAKLHISQVSAQKLTVGNNADVFIPGLRDALKATVSFISPSLDTGSTTVEVWLKLDNRGGRLKVGTPVHAVMRGTTVNDAIQLPASAILPGRESGTAVMVIGTDNLAHVRAVVVGIRTPQSVQVLSGLTASDNVITEGGYGLDDGTKVVVRSAGADDSDPADSKSGVEAKH